MDVVAEIAGHLAAGRQSKIYPVSFWFLPVGSTAAAGLLERFKSRPRSKELWSALLRARVF